MNELFSKQSKFYTPNNIKKLIFGLNRGDREAFKIIFNSFHRKIYNTSKKMGISHEDAEGIVQDVFLLLWENRASIDHTLSLNAYLLTIAKRLVIKRVKRNLLKEKHELNNKNLSIDYSNCTEEYLVFTETEQNVQSSIDQLPLNRRQIFMLSKENGMSNDEIAQKLKITKRTVENQLYRATKAIKDHLKEQNK